MELLTSSLIIVFLYQLYISYRIVFMQKNLKEVTKSLSELATLTKQQKDLNVFKEEMGKLAKELKLKSEDLDKKILNTQINNKKPNIAKKKTYLSLNKLIEKDPSKNKQKRG